MWFFRKKREDKKWDTIQASLKSSFYNIKRDMNQVRSKGDSPASGDVGYFAVFCTLASPACRQASRSDTAGNVLYPLYCCSFIPGTCGNYHRFAITVVKLVSYRLSCIRNSCSVNH